MTYQCRLLVVDDERRSRNSLSIFFRNECCWTVEACGTQVAFEWVKRESYDLVLIDASTEGANSLELCSELHASTKETGIIVLSWRDSEKDTIQALETGADDYITKPFRPRELVARCRALLRRVRARNDREESVIQAGDLILDLGRRIVRKAGNVIRLTPTEYDLLVFFMKHPDSLLRRAQLLSAIWGTEYCNEAEYLRNYVGQLRKKIEEDPANPKYLMTEPWVGYRFCTSPELS